MVFVFQFDEEFLGRQEAQAQLLKREEKINELEAELQAYRNQVPMLFSLFVLATSVTVFDRIAARIPFFFCSHCCFSSVSLSGFSLFDYLSLLDIKYDPLCEIQTKVSKSNYDISIKVWFLPLISL